MLSFEKDILGQNIYNLGRSTNLGSTSPSNVNILTLNLLTKESMLA
jgi:hypothetical protein